MKPKKQETPAYGDMFRLRLQYPRVVSAGGEKLGVQDGIYNVIQVFIQTNPFREQDPQYDGSNHSPAQCQCGYAPAGARCPVRLGENLPPGLRLQEGGRDADGHK